MQEILAENLQDFFNNTKLHGKRTYKGEDYEVWEVSDEAFKSMCNLNEEDFEKLCPEGMWRSAIGSNMGRPDVEYKIKGNTIFAWDGNSRSDYEAVNAKSVLIEKVVLVMVQKMILTNALWQESILDY